MGRGVSKETREGDRLKRQQSRLMEEETEIRKQKTDNCKYKYVMLQNGIKVII